MFRPVAGLILLAIFSSTAFGQVAAAPSADTPSAVPPATFQVADVHTSAHSQYPFMSGPDRRGDRYIIRDASMVDLISTAYGMDADNILGGPAWLETDRFDVIGKTAATTPSDTLKLMMQALLAERFKLVLHKDSQPEPAFVLSKGKGKPSMKESDGSGKSGCDPQQQAPTPGTVPFIVVSCHDMTMAELAKSLHDMAGGYLSSPVVDSTGMEGTWSFDLKWTGRGNLAKAGDDGITIFDAVDKELGLRLELQKAPMPVIVVDSVNEKATDNSPEVATLLPSPPPAEFDVAVIKPSAPNTTLNGRIDGGQVSLEGATLKFLIDYAWELNPSDSQQIVGAPKWLDSDHYDIVAKANIEAGSNAPEIDQVDLERMVQRLLAERFHLSAHMDDRPISAYTLVSDKPKIAKANPSNRTRCKEGPGTDGKDPRIVNPILNRLITCQNMTMTQFAGMLQNIASGYIYSPVKDATGLEGGWDFTLSFSGIGQFQNGPSAAPPPGALAASDPTGALPLPEAVSKQLGLKLVKEVRPAPVLVIDHVDEKPTDN